MNQFILNSTTKFVFTILIFVFSLTGCKKDDPKKEDTPELITKATLTFTPSDGSSSIIATATDPDGDGVQPIKTDGGITLSRNKTYVLTITLINGLAKPTDPAYDVSKEVEADGDEHQFYFAWTNSVFASPTGNGNIDLPNDPMNYTGGSNSVDKNNRPLGLTTTWTAANPPSGTLAGTFRILLKHQPGLKSATSDSNTGETDLDLTFTITIQ